ncbi:zeta toxin family protein [Microbacterium sp.]|uniref:zeta toxin family protein n=1 Tax=Microbacterium sp. TaxID=51671 RepID=UPI003A916B93
MAESADAGRVQDVILHSLFDDASPSETPAFVVLAGAPGAGTGRVITRLRREHGGDLVPVSIEDLQAFHPRYLDTQFRQSPAGREELSQLAASWLQASIRHARENGYSLLLEGEFRTPDTALGVARRFADSGYAVHVVTVAARDDQSLLAATSLGLRHMREGQTAEFVTPAENEQSMRNVSALIVAAADSPLVARVSVLNQHGVSVFDAERSESGTLSGASVALSTSRSEAMSALDATQWLSELRHMTEYARSLRTVPAPAIASLIDLHEMAIRRVVPELPVPPGSEVVRIQQQKLATDLAGLKRLQLRPEVVDAAAPTVTPAESGPSISR